MVTDLRLKLALDTKSLDSLIGRVKVSNAEIQAANKQAAAEGAAMEENNNRARIGRATASQKAIARAEYDLSRAIADITTERFERLRLIESANNKLRLVRFQGNNELVELEARRHMMKLEAITAQEGAFASTPFQKMLGNLERLTGFQGNRVMQAGSAAGGMVGIGGAAGMEGEGAAAMGMGAIAATAAIGALTLGFVEAAKAGRELELADRALEATLRSTGKSAQFQMEELNKLAEQTSDTTAFTTEQAKAAERMLLTFDNISGQTMPKVLEVAADMAQQFGKSLPDAARELGLAMEDPIKGARILRQVNVDLTESQKKQIKIWQDSGQEGKAMALILDLIGKNTQGAAAAAGTAWGEFGHRFHNIWAEMGKGIFDVSDQTVKGLLLEWDVLTGQMERAKNEVEAIKKGAASLTKTPAVDIGIKVSDVSEKEKASQSALLEELKQARIEGMQDENKKIVALENLKYTEKRAKLIEENESFALLTMGHEQRLVNIHAEQAKKAADDAAKLAKKTEQTTLEEEDKKQRLLIEHDKKSTTVIRQGIKQQQQDEEEAARAEARIWVEKAGYVQQYGQSLSSMIGIIGGKSKAAFALQQSIAEGEIAVRTAAAIVTDNSNPLTVWKVPYDIALGISQAAVVAATTIKGFEGGGFTGYGGSHDVAGVVHRGEYVVPHDDLARMGGPRGMERMLQGGTTTVHAPISITINGNADDRTVKAIGMTVQQELKKLRIAEKKATYTGTQA